MKEYTLGSYAPINDKASLATDAELCFVCGRKLGNNPFYYEMNTDGKLMIKGSDPENSQGAFPIGVSCANKFEAGILFRFEMAVA